MVSDEDINPSVRNQETVVRNITAIPSPRSSAEPAELNPRITLGIPQEQAGTSRSHQSSRPSSPDSRPRAQSNASSSVLRLARHEMWTPRDYHTWKSPLLMFTFYLLGLGISIGHCAFYPSLKNKIVGSSRNQESNIRIGTAFAFISQIAQIALTASVWQAYTQWIWRSVKKTPMYIATLNDIFGADTSVLPFLNMDMLRNFRIGYIIGVFAWTLILPPFFTPGTLSVYQSTNQIDIQQPTPYLTIANDTEGHLYSYSPSEQGDRFNYKDVPARIFTGPRSILTLLSTATASQGVILPIKSPFNHSSYSINFFGPAVQCRQADPTVESKIDDLLKQRMDKPVGTAKAIKYAYYAFIPSFDAQGNITALSDVRYQVPVNASNEVWMVFQRYASLTDSACDYKPYHQICKLWNATYDLDLSWENGFQNITGSHHLTHEVEYPKDKPHEISNMAQHAYSAFFWAFTDQIVGSFGLFYDTAKTTSNNTFGMISCPIQHNSLLGTADLDVFFDYNEDLGACQTPYGNLSAQRQQDKADGKNRTLGELMEEMSFNMTASLLHNDLLTHNTTRLTTVFESVNRYSYNPFALFIPYALACLFTSIVIVIGATTYAKHGVLPDKKFQDILSAGEDPDAIKLARDPTSRRRSMTVDFGGKHPTFRTSLR